jgi:hypothetical protein
MRWIEVDIGARTRLRILWDGLPKRFCSVRQSSENCEPNLLPLYSSIKTSHFFQCQAGSARNIKGRDINGREREMTRLHYLGYEGFVYVQCPPENDAIKSNALLSKLKTTQEFQHCHKLAHFVSLPLF